MKISNLEKYLSKQKNVVKPFIYTKPSVSEVCIKLFVLLALQIFLLIFTKSYNAVFVILTALAGAICSAALNFLIFKEPPYSSMTIIIQGLMIGMLLPDSFPLYAVFSITFFSLFLSRTLVFQSINSWINEAAVGIVIAWIIGSKFFPSFYLTPELVPIKNPSVFLIQNGTFPIYDFDRTITSFLNSSVFSWFKVTIPEGFISLLWDTQSIIPAFRFNLLTIISSIILFSDNSFSPIIPAIFLFVYLVLVRLFAPFIYGGAFNQGDILLAMLSSGTLFCAIFMIQWYGTTPITLSGKIFFGVISGIIAFVIIGCGTSPIGMAYTVLICNVVNMMIRYFEERKNNQLLEKVALKSIAANVKTGEVK